MKERYVIIILVMAHGRERRLCNPQPKLPAAQTYNIQAGSIQQAGRPIPWPKLAPAFLWQPGKTAARRRVFYFVVGNKGEKQRVRHQMRSSCYPVNRIPLLFRHNRSVCYHRGRRRRLVVVFAVCEHHCHLFFILFIIHVHFFLQLIFD